MYVPADSFTVARPIAWRQYVVDLEYAMSQLLPPDPAGKERWLRRAGMPESLLVPIAATDLQALQRHVGMSCEAAPRTRPGNAYCVATQCGPLRSNLPIWQHPKADILDAHIQVWVDIRYSGYRRAYRAAFPDEDLTASVIHHVMNRRYAQLHGFRYVRLVPISRSTNSSSAFTENWGVALTQDGTLRSRRNEADIAYAGLDDIMAMLDMPAGGGVMENVRQAAALLEPSGTA